MELCGSESWPNCERISLKVTDNRKFESIQCQIKCNQLIFINKMSFISEVCLLTFWLSSSYHHLQMYDTVLRLKSVKFIQATGRATYTFKLTGNGHLSQSSFLCLILCNFSSNINCDNVIYPHRISDFSFHWRMYIIFCLAK